jgi:hypothetical protein
LASAVIAPLREAYSTNAKPIVLITSLPFTVAFRVGISTLTTFPYSLKIFFLSTPHSFSYRSCATTGQLSTIIMLLKSRSIVAMATALDAREKKKKKKKRPRREVEAQLCLV